MKKMLLLLIALFCVVGLVACNTQSENQNEVSFTGTISEIKESSLIVIVTDGGDSNLAVGTTVDVSKNVTSADGCPELTLNDYVRVSFNGDVMEKDPPTLGTVFSIHKTDETGKSIGD